MDILKKLHSNEIFFRIENDEEGYYFSIIDRGVYPRIWADNFASDDSVIIAETTDNLINRTTIGGKDWTMRWFGKTVDECLILVEEWLEKTIQARLDYVPPIEDILKFGIIKDNDIDVSIKVIHYGYYKYHILNDNEIVLRDKL